jgi:hypothetical protein
MNERYELRDIWGELRDLLPASSSSTISGLGPLTPPVESVLHVTKDRGTGGRDDLLGEGRPLGKRTSPDRCAEMSSTRGEDSLALRTWLHGKFTPSKCQERWWVSLHSPSVGIRRPLLRKLLGWLTQRAHET